MLESPGSVKQSVRQIFQESLNVLKDPERSKAFERSGSFRTFKLSWKICRTDCFTDPGLSSMAITCAFLSSRYLVRAAINRPLLVPNAMVNRTVKRIILD